jgi:hypothetical protein
MSNQPDLSYAALSAYLDTLPDSAIFGDDRFTCPLAELAHHQGFPLVVVGRTLWHSLHGDTRGGALSAFGHAFTARYDRLPGRHHRIRTVKRLLAALAPTFGSRQEAV